MRIFHRKKIKFIKSKLDTPIIRLYGGMKPLYAILDTGSEITLVDTNILIQASVPYIKKNKKDNIQMIGVSGCTDGYPVPVETNLSLTRNKITRIGIKGFQHDLSDLSRQFRSRGGDGDIVTLIGMNMLSEMNAKLDIKKQRLIIEK